MLSTNRAAVADRTEVQVGSELTRGGIGMSDLCSVCGSVLENGECVACFGFSTLSDAIEESQQQGKSDREWEQEWSDRELAKAEEDVQARIDAGKEPVNYDAEPMSHDARLADAEDRSGWRGELTAYACAALQGLISQLDRDALATLTARTNDGPSIYLPLCRQAWHIAVAMNQARIEDTQAQSDGGDDLPF